MKKIIAVIAALTMAAASLTACQKSGESTAKTAKVIDIDLTMRSMHSELTRISRSFSRR